MKSMHRWLNAKCKELYNDRSGSETIEMVFSAAMLCMILMTTLFIIAYALQIGSVTYAAKRITRYVEVTGQAQQHDLNNLLHSFLTNANEIEAEITIENVEAWKIPATRKLDYRSGFTIVIRASYKIPVIQMGTGDPLIITAPIVVAVTGQSEIYWKTQN